MIGARSHGGLADGSPHGSVPAPRSRNGEGPHTGGRQPQEAPGAAQVVEAHHRPLLRGAYGWRQGQATRGVRRARHRSDPAGPRQALGGGRAGQKDRPDAVGDRARGHPRQKGRDHDHPLAPRQPRDGASAAPAHLQGAQGGAPRERHRHGAARQARERHLPPARRHRQARGRGRAARGRAGGGPGRGRRPRREPLARGGRRRQGRQGP